MNQVSPAPIPPKKSCGQLAAGKFRDGFYCAESVLLAIAESEGVENPHLSRLMSGFCGGVSRSNQMCGALLGAVAGLGLLYGRNTPEDDKTVVYKLANQMVKRFTEEFGSSLCSGVLGCDISTREGEREFLEKELGATRCLEVTSRAAEIAEELVQEHRLSETPQES